MRFVDKKVISIFIYNFFVNLRFSRALLMIYCMNLGVSVIQFGVIQSIYSLSRLIFEVPSGIIADKFKRKNVLGAASFISAIMYILLFFFNKMTKYNLFVPLIIIFIIDAFAFSLISGTDQALLFDILPKENREEKYTRYVSFMQIVGLSCLSLSTILGGVISEFGVCFSFLIQGISSLLAFISILFTKEEKGVLKSEGNSSYKIGITALKTMKSSNVLIIMMILVAIIDVNINSITIFIQGYFEDLNMELTLISSVIGFSTLAGILGAFISPRFLKLKSEILLLFSGVTGMLSICLISYKNIFISILGFMLLNVLVELIYPLISTFINVNIESNSRATVISMVSFVSGVISSIVYPMYGKIINLKGYSSAFRYFGISSFFVVILIGIYFGGRRKNDVKSAKESL